MISEEKIRPSELMKQKESCIDWDRQYLLERKAKFELVSCPACCDKTSSFSFTKLGFDYHECPRCQTVFLNPRPTLEILTEFYKQSRNYDFWNKYIFPASEEARREGIFKPRVEKILNYKRKFFPLASSVIEIGAAYGIMCEELHKSGEFTRILAVEPTPGLAETCRKKGIETIESNVESIPSGINAEILVAFEVIEHLHNPIEFLNHCHRILPENGLLILSCPNFKGFDVQLLKEKSNVIDHEHLNYFNPWSMRELISKAGFETLEVTTPGKLDTDIVHERVKSGMIDVSKDPLLKIIFMEKHDELKNRFQEFLVSNLLSSHMLTVARKK